MEITISDGMVYIGGVERDGKRGILLRQMDEAHPVNTPDPEWHDGKSYTPTERDVVIWLGSLESARVLQDRVNIVCLNMNGFDVSDVMQNAELHSSECSEAERR